MAVESKKNETSAEKNVKSEASNGEEFVKINGEGESKPAWMAIFSLHAFLKYVMCIKTKLNSIDKFMIYILDVFFSSKCFFTFEFFYLL